MKRFLLFFVSLFFLTGCGEKPEYQVRMALNSWPGYEPLLLAKEMGFYGDMVPRIMRVYSNTDTVKALRSGLLDIAALTVDEVLRLAQEDAEITVFLILDVSDGGDAVIGQKEITSMTELKGKRVGVEAGALGAYVLTRAIEQTEGLTLPDIEIYPVTYKNHEELFQCGEVDAVVTFEPVKTRLTEQGGNVLFDSRRIPNEILDVLVVRNEIARNHPEAIRTIVRGWFRSQAYIKAKPKPAFARMARYENISASLFSISYRSMHFPTLEENRQLLAPDRPGIIDAVDRVKKNLLKNRIILKDIPLEPLFTDRFLIKGEQ